MRNIKFRGKTGTTEGKKWVYGYLYKIKSFFSEDYQYFIKNEHLQETSVDEDTIGQYTGLKDKNGKEIYEGDIIKCSFYPDFIFEIKFTELCWYMRKIPTSEHIKLSDVLYEDLEVIGNIYDNKNLLEEGR